jgi:uncharacterized protein with HEPN domain
MPPEVKKCLFDASEAIRAIRAFTHGLDAQDYLRNDLVKAAVERKFEIIGEALNRIQRIDSALLNHITNAYRIIGFRNILAHGYDVIDHNLVWDIIANHLARLDAEIEHLMEASSE